MQGGGTAVMDAEEITHMFGSDDEEEELDSDYGEMEEEEEEEEDGEWEEEGEWVEDSENEDGDEEEEDEVEAMDHAEEGEEESGDEVTLVRCIVSFYVSDLFTCVDIFFCTDFHALNVVTVIDGVALYLNIVSGYGRRQRGERRR